LRRSEGEFACSQDDGDDFFGEEAAEADLAQGEVRQAIQAANKINREAEDINPEELERYIKERFEAPAQQYTAGSDFNEQTGTPPPPLFTPQIIASVLSQTMEIMPSCMSNVKQGTVGEIL
jgi:hypothetical protein